MTDTTPSQLLFSTDRTDTIKVRTREGDGVGTLHALLVNKRTGIAAYAVLTIGGFMGMGKAYYPLPFELLHYDAEHDRYTITVERRVLEGGPSWSNNAPAFDQPYADRVASYYGTKREDLTFG